MEYVALIGLIFVPLLCFLCAAWGYVRWQNGDEEEEALKSKKAFKCFLIAGVIALVVFGVLKVVFPISA